MSPHEHHPDECLCSFDPPPVLPFWTVTNHCTYLPACMSISYVLNGRQAARLLLQVVLEAQSTRRTVCIWQNGKACIV